MGRGKKEKEREVRLRISALKPDSSRGSLFKPTSPGTTEGKKEEKGKKGISSTSF